MRTARAAHAKRPPEPDAFGIAVRSWQEKVSRELESAGFAAGWRTIVAEAVPTQLGLERAIQNVSVLKWRIRERRDESLDDADRNHTSLCTRLDIWGSSLIQVGLGRAQTSFTREEDRTFGTDFRSDVEEVRAWASRKDPLLQKVVDGLVETINDRYDNQLPYQLRPVDAWHVGWAVSTIAWLLADVVGDVIPCGANRLCRFPDAQGARRSFRDAGVLVCPRCGADITPDSDVRTGGRTDFKLISATCDSCELVVMFPDQALPESLWNGPYLKLHSAESAENDVAPENVGTEQPRSSTSTEGEANSQPDPRRVFIIHGRNAAARLAIERFVQTLGLQAIDFDQLAADHGAEFVGNIVRAGLQQAQGIVALFTPDEFAVLGASPLRGPHDAASDLQRWQARPNVIFEAGIAFGIARERTILVTLGSEVSLFSDIAGIHILRLNNSIESRKRFRQKLIGVRCEVDQRSDAWTNPEQSGDFETCVANVSLEAQGDSLLVRSSSDSARAADRLTFPLENGRKCAISLMEITGLVVRADAARRSGGRVEVEVDSSELTVLRAQESSLGEANQSDAVKAERARLTIAIEDAREHADSLAKVIRFFLVDNRFREAFVPAPSDAATCLERLLNQETAKDNGSEHHKIDLFVKSNSAVGCSVSVPAQDLLAPATADGCSSVSEYMLKLVAFGGDSLLVLPRQLLLAVVFPAIARELAVMNNKVPLSGDVFERSAWYFGAG